MRRLLIVLFVCSLAAAQNVPDSSLLAEIQKIPAIDNHTHVMKVTGPGERDDEFDALPCDTLEAWDYPVFLRPDRPEIVSAWKALYGYRYDDQSPEHVKELIAARDRLMQQQGDNFPSWVLEKINTKIMFANRVAMGRGLVAPRFPWVPYDDALLFPFDNTYMADTPDRKFFFDRQNALLKRYMTELQVTTVPKTFNEYVQRVIVPTLQRQKQSGAVALKFEVAYLRALDFWRVPDDAGETLYHEFATM